MVVSSEAPCSSGCASGETILSTTPASPTYVKTPNGKWVVDGSSKIASGPAPPAVASSDTTYAPGQPTRTVAPTKPAQKVTPDDAQDLLGWMLSRWRPSSEPKEPTMLNAFTPAPPMPQPPPQPRRTRNAFSDAMPPGYGMPPGYYGMPQAPYYGPQQPYYSMPTQAPSAPAAPATSQQTALPPAHSGIQQAGHSMPTADVTPMLQRANAAMDRPATMTTGTPTAADPAALVQLMQSVRESPHPYVRESAVISLAGYDWRVHPSVVALLTHAAVNDPAGSVRAACVHHLVRMNVPAQMTFETFNTLRNDGDVRVRYEVETALKLPQGAQ
jgi:hypothetical protein